MADAIGFDFETLLQSLLLDLRLRVPWPLSNEVVRALVVTLSWGERIHSLEFCGFAL